jgi:hypothetical protein
VRCPHYPVKEVNDLAKAAQAGLGPSPRYNHRKTTQPVMDRLDMGLSQATRFILEHLAALTVGQFSETLNRPEYPLPADVYGNYRDGCNWYVKVAIDDVPRLHVVSHHPAEFRIQTNSGMIDAC